MGDFFGVSSVSSGQYRDKKAEFFCIVGPRHLSARYVVDHFGRIGVHIGHSKSMWPFAMTSLVMLADVCELGGRRGLLVCEVASSRGC